MRSLALVGLALLGGAGGLAAQHAQEYEFGAFGSYTKYDPSFNLANKIGGGVRLGYHFGDRLGLEADVLFQPEYTLTGTNTTIEPLIGGGSLTFNLLHGAANSLYILAGYSRLDFGATAPYRFTDGGFHGAVGDRITLTNHLALRLEARAIYTTDTKSSFSTTASTSARTRRKARSWTRWGAPSTQTTTACRMASTGAPTPLPAPRWTRWGVPWRRTRTATACRTTSTSVPTPRQEPRWTRSGARWCP